MNLHYHWHRLANRYLEYDIRAWRHLYWLVSNEQRATKIWHEGKWMDRKLFNELCDSVKEAGRMKRDHDAVNHPKHYTTHPSGVECIQVTEHMNFCRGNAIKYIWRAGEKGDALEDLRKARWYIDREIARLTPSPTQVQDDAAESEYYPPYGSYPTVSWTTSPGAAKEGE